MIEISDHKDIDQAFKDLDRDATSALNSRKKLYIQWGTDKGMSQAQRGSLHLWCEKVAKVLNDAGLPLVKKGLFNNESIECDWTMILVKEHIYKTMLKAMTDKSSTEQQSTVDPSHVAETISRHFANNGVVLPFWPSKRG